MKTACVLASQGCVAVAGPWWGLTFIKDNSVHAPANGRRRYNVTSSLIGWAHAQNYLWFIHGGHVHPLWRAGLTTSNAGRHKSLTQQKITAWPYSACLCAGDLKTEEYTGDVAVTSTGGSYSSCLQCLSQPWRCIWGWYLLLNYCSQHIYTKVPFHKEFVSLQFKYRKTSDVHTWKVSIISGHNFVHAMVAHANLWPDWNITMEIRRIRHHGVSNHHYLYCLFNRLFRRTSTKISVLRVSGLCEGNPPVTGGFSASRDNDSENVFILWRHRVELRVYKPLEIRSQINSARRRSAMKILMCFVDSHKGKDKGWVQCYES